MALPQNQWARATNHPCTTFYYQKTILDVIAHRSIFKRNPHCTIGSVSFRECSCLVGASICTCFMRSEGHCRGDTRAFSQHWKEQPYTVIYILLWGEISFGPQSKAAHELCHGKSRSIARLGSKKDGLLRPKLPDCQTMARTLIELSVFPGVFPPFDWATLETWSVFLIYYDTMWFCLENVERSIIYRPPTRTRFIHDYCMFPPKWAEIWSAMNIPTYICTESQSLDFFYVLT